MKIIYTDGMNPLPEGMKADHYMNGDYFSEVKFGAKEVTVLGDYPNIVKAYAKVKIKAEVVKPKQEPKQK